MPCFNLGVGGLYSNIHKQDQSVSVDELQDPIEITALQYALQIIILDKTILGLLFLSFFNKMGKNVKSETGGFNEFF